MSYDYTTRCYENRPPLKVGDTLKVVEVSNDNVDSTGHTYSACYLSRDSGHDDERVKEIRKRFDAAVRGPYRVDGWHKSLTDGGWYLRNAEGVIIATVSFTEEETAVGKPLNEGNPTARFLAEAWGDIYHLLSLLPVQSPQQKDDRWVTFGKIKLDPETETETFERIPIQPAASTPTVLCNWCDHPESYLPPVLVEGKWVHFGRDGDGQTCTAPTCLKCKHPWAYSYGEEGGNDGRCYFPVGPNASGGQRSCYCECEFPTTVASTEAQDVTHTDDENVERWRSTMIDRDTTVATTPPSLTEQARQLVKEWLESMPRSPAGTMIADANIGSANIQSLERLVASFAAEAATQGQASGIEMVANRLCGACHMFPYFERARQNGEGKWTHRHRTGLSELDCDAKKFIMENSPDPSYLNRVAELERKLAELKEVNQGIIDGIADSKVLIETQHQTELNRVRNEAATAALEQELDLLLRRAGELGLDDGFSSHYQHGFEMFRSKMQSVIKARIAAIRDDKLEDLQSLHGKKI